MREFFHGWRRKVECGAMSAKFLRSPNFWVITLGLALMIGWPLVQISRYRRAFEPFTPIGAWLYSGGDDMGVPLRGPEGVQQVHFYDKGIGDAELFRVMVHLKRFPRLHSLYLDHTQITDAILPQLAELKLSRLDIRKTKVTAQGVKQFRRQVPKCEVDWQQEGSDP